MSSLFQVWVVPLPVKSYWFSAPLNCILNIKYVLIWCCAVIMLPMCLKTTCCWKITPFALLTRKSWFAVENNLNRGRFWNVKWHKCVLAFTVSCEFVHVLYVLITLMESQWLICNLLQQMSTLPSPSLSLTLILNYCCTVPVNPT